MPNQSSIYMGPGGTGREISRGEIATEPGSRIDPEGTSLRFAFRVVRFSAVLGLFSTGALIPESAGSMRALRCCLCSSERGFPR